MDAVLLDVGGVLLVPHADAVNPALAPFGMQLSREQAERAHYAGARSLDAADAATDVDGSAYLIGYAAAVGISDTDREPALTRLRAAFGSPSIAVWRQPVIGSVAGLRSLAATGIKLGIISNADGTIERQLRVNEICQVGAGLGVPVLAIIDSTVVGVAKPAAAIFRHALDPLGVSPEQAVYVGDTVRYDVRGARNAGVRPIHFDPYDLCDSKPDHAHVRSIAEVAGLL
ncbi:MAG TPA: HAD family hydrolase [Chloroflexota bacterium]|nr:HAD family hydrolase [Chloroflexota bacterium]